MNSDVRINVPRRGRGAAVCALPDDGSLAWYKVVGIEFVLFAGIVVTLICGALIAR